ncbi:MAG: FAD-dependent oxidoreductase [Patescibacteria group bacterium]
MKQEETKKIKYKVVSKKIETPNVATLSLSTTSRLPSYCPGQFIDIYFPEFGFSQGKSYSISSAPREKKFSITVKKIGEFSSRLFKLKEGAIITGSLPYGFFYSDLENTHLVMLAGGIGIAPFRATIMEHLMKNSGRKISLFYSSRTEDDIIFKNELDSWQIRHPHLKIKHFITRQAKIHPEKIKGRITAERVLKEISLLSKSLANVEFLICGSIAFVRDMRKGLRAKGVPENLIYTEAFFSH